jgi:hypothetical protein
MASTASINDLVIEPGADSELEQSRLENSTEFSRLTSPRIIQRRTWTAESSELISQVLPSAEDAPQHTAPQDVVLPTVTSFKPLSVPPLEWPASRRTILQRWEGVVSEVREDEFDARLTDLTSPRAPEEQATFPMSEISASDEPLVEPGAVFYWYIGYEDKVGGQRERTSGIRFRRLPAVRSATPDPEIDALAELFGVRR